MNGSLLLKVESSSSVPVVVSPGTVSETPGVVPPATRVPCVLFEPPELSSPPAETPHKAYAESHDEYEPDHNRAIW